MSKHRSSANWQGNLKEGKGTMVIGGGAWEGSYSFKSRFEDGKGTSPEELIAAAHAGCFSMAFSNELDQAGYKPEQVKTNAEATLENTGGGFVISKIHLSTKGKVPGIGNDEFQKIANSAKENCPVSKTLKAVEISMDAELIG